MSLDMDGFRRQTEQASNHVGTVMRAAVQTFAKANSEIVGIGATSATAYASKWTSAITKTVVGIGAGKLAIGAAAVIMAGAIMEARRQLEEMVEIAEKAGKSNVSAEFFQKFTAEYRKAKVDIGDLESALTNAFQATKEKLDQINPVLERLREFYLGGFFSTGDNAQGLDLFRNAGSQDDKIRAVLVSMTELERIGERLASLDIGEKMFGATFVDRIRQGKTSAQELLATIDKMKVEKGDIFSNQVVKETEEIDRRLKIASETLEKNLRPAFDGLADAANTIKNTWAGIVELLAKGAAILDRFSRANRYAGDIAERASLEAQLAADKDNAAARASAGLAPSAQRQAAERRLAELNAMLSKYDTDKGAAASFGEFKMSPDSGPPLPPGRPKPYDAPARESGVSRDRFDASADSIEKRTAALKAETSAIDLGTQAREAARVTAELETVAKQANTLAGVNNGEVTAEQAERIRQVAAAYGAAALAAEQAKGPLASFAREARNSNRMLQEAAVSGLRGFEDALISIIDRTSTVQEAFKKMAQSILNDLARIAIRQAITGPLAGALGLAFPGRAAGGPVEAGQPYMVGERGPELFVPRASGRIVPNNVASRGNGGGVVVQITNAPSFSTDMSPAARAQIMSDMERNNSMLRAEIVQDIRAGLSNDSSFLTR
jgi:hypothetical protein